eukprot:2905418-Rhodomonas_salina.1
MNPAFQSSEISDGNRQLRHNRALTFRSSLTQSSSVFFLFVFRVCTALILCCRRSQAPELSDREEEHELVELLREFEEAAQLPAHKISSPRESPLSESERVDRLPSWLTDDTMLWEEWEGESLQPCPSGARHRYCPPVHPLRRRHTEGVVATRSLDSHPLRAAAASVLHSEANSSDWMSWAPSVRPTAAHSHATSPAG